MRILRSVHGGLIAVSLLFLGANAPTPEPVGLVFGKSEPWIGNIKENAIPETIIEQLTAKEASHSDKRAFVQYASAEEAAKAGAEIVFQVDFSSSRSGRRDEGVLRGYTSDITLDFKRLDAGTRKTNWDALHVAMAGADLPVERPSTKGGYLVLGGEPGTFVLHFKCLEHAVSTIPRLRMRDAEKRAK